MRVKSACLICLLMVLAVTVSAIAQEGHPLTGTWYGEFGPNATKRNDLTVILNWDGKTVTGIVNPGPNVVQIKVATLDSTINNGLFILKRTPKTRRAEWITLSLMARWRTPLRTTGRLPEPIPAVRRRATSNSRGINRNLSDPECWRKSRFFPTLRTSSFIFFTNPDHYERRGPSTGLPLPRPRRRCQAERGEGRCVPLCRRLLIAPSLPKRLR